MRVDQWLWAVRIFKSRTLAGEAARTGQVFVDGRRAKASTPLRAGQTVDVVGRLRGVTRKCRLRVLGIPPSRVSASRADEFRALEPIAEEPSSREPEWWSNAEWWGEVDAPPEDDS